MRRKLNVKLVFGTLAGLLIAAAATFALHEYQVRANAHRLLERADRAVLDKDYDKAITIYPQYLLLVPNDADTVQKYAEVLDLRADTVADRVRLVLLMEQVLRMKPTQEPFRLRLVHNLIALSRYSEAIENLQKLLPTTDDKAAIHHKIGWCLEAKKDYAQAAKSFEKAVQLDPKRIESYALLMEVLEDRLHQPEAALQTMNDMVKVNAGSHQAYLLRARFLRRRGEDQAAAADLQAAAKLSPEQPEVILDLADAARARGQWDEAARLLNDGIKRHPAYSAFYKALADGAVRAGKIDEAIASLQEGLRHTPQATELAVLLIDLQIDGMQFSQARAKIDELLKAGLRPTLPNYLIARLMTAEGQWHDAIKMLEAARLDLGPKSDWTGRVNALLGACYRHIGDAEQELQAFRRAVEAEPSWSAAAVGLGSALLSSGRIDEASLTLEPLRRLKNPPAGYWPLLARSRLYRQARLPESQRRWDDVEEALNEGAQFEPTSVDLQLAQAELAAARNDWEAARGILEKAKQAEPDRVEVWIALAELAARQNRGDDAEKLLDEAAQQNSTKGQLDLQLARIRLWTARARSEDQAKLSRLGTLLADLPSREDRGRLARALGESWYRLSKWERAAQMWKLVADDAPNDVRSRFALFEIALQAHDVPSARRWQTELRELEGQAGRFGRYAEAAILVREARGQRAMLADARKRLQELESTQKDWPAVPLLLATISELEGKEQKATQEYTRALDLGEIDARAVRRLVELLLARREFSKAESALAKYEQKRGLTPDLARLGADAALGLRDRRSAQLAMRRAELAVALPSRDYRDYLWLAPIYRAAGESARAEQALRTSLELAPHAPDTWIAWTEHLALTDQRGLAMKELDRLKKELPSDRLPLTLARCYDAMNQIDLAEQAYGAALTARPRDAALLAYAADFHRRADQAASAQKLYERLLDPGLRVPGESVVNARRELAMLLARTDRERAIGLIDENARNRGDSAIDQRIRLYLRGQDERTRAEAITLLQDALRRQPPSPDERLMLAELLQSAGNLGPARTQLAAAVDEAPAQPRCLVRYAQLLIRLAELDEAGSAIARLEALEPASRRVNDLKAALSAAVQTANAKKR